MLMVMLISGFILSLLSDSVISLAITASGIQGDLSICSILHLKERLSGDDTNKI